MSLLFWIALATGREVRVPIRRRAVAHVKNYFAGKLGWGNRKVRLEELPRVASRRKRKRIR